MAYPADDPTKGSSNPAKMNKKAAKEFERINRAHRTLSAGNRTLLRASDEMELLHDMCRVIVEKGGYRLASVAYAEHDEQKTIRWIACVGIEKEFLEALHFTWADTEWGRTATGSAIRTGKPSVGRNLLTDPGFASYVRLREDAIKRGYASSTAFPLRVEGEVLGALVMAAVEPDAFDEAEVELLSELADDLAYGITSIRTRIKHQEAEARVLEVRLLHKESVHYSKVLEQTLREVEASHELIRRQKDELKSLYDKVVAEQQVAERLLLNVLPYPIAARLKARPDFIAGSLPEIIADSFPEVTALFADIVEFTRFSAGMSAERLVAVLNEIFSDFDSIADQRGLEKIKTIGDAYMAAAGLPVPAPDHAARAAHMALDMIDALERFNARSGYRLQLRIGINSGAVVAGVIGKRKFIYDLWSDAVNIASRMESHGVAGRVQVTDATRRLLGAPFLFEERGTIDVKGMGALHTWFLAGRHGASSVTL